MIWRTCVLICLLFAVNRSYLGHSVCCSHEEELYQWLAAISHAQVNYALTSSFGLSEVGKTGLVMDSLH